MKKVAGSLLAIFVLITLSFAAPKEKTFTGEIMDSQCAKMGSHEMMLKKEGMGDRNPSDPMARKMCTLNCVKMGGKYILFDRGHKKIYQLGDQSKPEQFAGAAVKVKGTLDKNTRQSTCRTYNLGLSRL